MKIIKRICIELLCVLFFYFVLFLIFGYWFETNDDIYISMILSGTLTGKASPYAIHLNPILSVPMAGLYSIIPNIPWYGLFLMICMFIVTFFTVHAVFDGISTEKWWIAICIAMLLSSYQIKYIVRPQFTSTAAYLAVTGFVILLMYDRRNIRFILFIVLELFSALLRIKAMLMIQPFGILMYLAVRFIKNRQSGEKRIGVKTLRDGLTCAIPVAVIIISCYFSYNIFYSAEWKNFVSYNTARAKIFDIYGKPSYNEIEDILMKYDVSENKYKAFSNYVMLDWDALSNLTEEIAEYSKNNNSKEMRVIPILKEMLGMTIFSKNKSVALLFCGLWALAAGIIICYGLWDLFAPLAGFILLKLGIWGYLIMNGRLPDRIMGPLKYCEIIMLFAIVLCRLNMENISGKKMTKIIRIAVTSFCVALTGVFVRYYYTELKGSDDINKILRQTEEEIENYCNKSDNNYIISDTIASNNKMSPFDSMKKDNNFIISGGWFAASPDYQTYVDEYLNSSDTIYYITVNGSDAFMEYEEPYLEEFTNSDGVQVDNFIGATGAEYVVWKYVFNE